MKWADELERLPTLSMSQAWNLKVETSDIRVWLSRCGLEDGEPFTRTVYVEALRDGQWMDMGCFDGDEDDPRPVGSLFDGWQATLLGVAWLSEHQR